MGLYFEQYDLDGNNDLSPREFGMFLVSHVNQKELGKWVERVEVLRDMKVVSCACCEMEKRRGDGVLMQHDVSMRRATSRNRSSLTSLCSWSTWKSSKSRSNSSCRTTALIKVRTCRV